jgi:hypothetical protein
MPRLSFTDEELESLSTLASTLQPSLRGGFLECVAKLAWPRARAARAGLAAEVQRDILRGGIAVGVAPKIRGGKWG